MSPAGSEPPVAWRSELDCNLTAVPTAAAAARRFLLTSGCNDTEASACELALVEACNNAILHAGGPARGLPIVLEAFCRPRQIELRIIDHTQGFEWPTHVDLPQPDQECGRGLFLIQAVMDSATYRREAGENVLVLHKRRAMPA